MVARLFYKVFRYLLFKIRIKGMKNISRGEPVILVSNHAGSFGPISIITSFPWKLYPWVAHEVTDVRTVAKRIQADFFEAELHLSPPLARFFARVIGRICVALMKDIDAIPVYDKSKKIKSTVDQSLRLMEQGKNILVFPEDSQKPMINEVLFDFCTGFLHLAKLYFEKTRKAVSFLPVAVNRRVKSILIGKPIRFDGSVPFPEEKIRLKRELEATITTLYASLEDRGDLDEAAGQK
jgi:1-acyl-sn-glycerol-3-phosphate acyltransferase